jgi:hypothetical protein
MSYPFNVDIGMRALIMSSTTVPVAKSAYLPSVDLQNAPNGYVYFDTSDITSLHDSEGLSDVCEFSLDVACVAHENSKRKALVTDVLSVLQPIVNGRRTQLTAYLIPDTGVFINFLRLESQNESSILKTGQSNPDMTIIVLSFSCKATC